MKSTAAILVQTKEPLDIWTIDVPALKEGQILVEIKCTGLCHSQLNEIRGKKGEDRFLPHTLGHEGAGVVLEVGSGVKKVQPGDHVVLTWIKGEGLEGGPVQYSYGGKTVNSGPISTFMNNAVVSENRVVKIDKGISFEAAALLGCAVPTGAGIVFNTANVQDGQTVAIFGTGGLGLSAILAAKAKGASEIIAVDIVDDKLDQAKAFGATHVVNARNQSVEDEIMKRTSQRGVDFSIETAGVKQVMEQSFRSVKNGGGLCVLAGNLPVGQRIELDPFDLIKGKQIKGTWGGESNPDRDIPMYLGLQQQGKFPFERLATHNYNLDQINEAFDALEQGRVGRALVSFH